MARPPKPPHTISQKNREFDELLRRAFEVLARSQAPKAFTKAQKRRSKVA
jgi:hypothetical protein